MTLWFVRGLRRGIVTTRYPGKPDASAGDLPTPPAFAERAIDRSLADRLVAVCPSHALSHDSKDLIFDVGACTACGRCAEDAGWAAQPSGEFELAVTCRADLIKRISLRQEEGAR